AAACHNARLVLPATLQLCEYVQEQSRQEANVQRAMDEAWWTQQFAAGAPVLELPTDHPRPAQWTFAGARACHPPNAPLCDALKRAAAQHDCTLFVMLLAAYFVFLRRLTSQEDIAVGIPIADRALAGGESVVGHCLNFLPLRARVSDDATFAEFVAEVKKLFLA